MSVPPESTPHTGIDLDRVRAGLRQAHPPDPEALAAERRTLAALEAGPRLARYRYFARLSGPGFLQSAMTLGAGSASASLFAGATFGYALLWVAPVAMLLGILVMAAIAHQTLSTGLRPFDAMRTYAGAPFAWAWASGALLASMIWHLPQYSLAAASIVDMAGVAGLADLPPMLASFAVLAWAIGMTSLYGASPRAVRWFERVLKYTVWGVVVCLGVVVAKTGIRDWDALWRGFFAFELPADSGRGISSFDIALSGLAAAVGINMVFLYPYSLLARGWGREHRGLARFDLITGMALPYVLATTLMILATANTVHLDPTFASTALRPIDAAESIASVIGPSVGKVVFLLGILGMAASTITMHMITTGFVCSELFGFPVGGWKYRLATWLPTPAVFAPWLWQETLWMAVPTTVICGAFLPIAYLGFAKLLGSRAYLGADLPRGWRAIVWRGGIYVLTVILIVALALYVANKWNS